MGSVIKAVGTSRGSRSLTNFDLEKILAASNQSTNDEWIVNRTGITRRFVSPDLDVGGLALKASLGALDKLADSNTDIVPIEYIIVATNTPKSPFPNLAGYLQSEIGRSRSRLIKNGAGGFDLYGGCGGINLALMQADYLIRSGQFRSILVVGAEKLSDVTDYSDRKTSILFGDGASAYALTNGRENEGFLGHYTQGNGENRGLITCVEKEKVDLVGALEILDKSVNPSKIIGKVLEMDGPRVFRYVVEQWIELLGSISKLFGRDVGYGHINYIAPHLANLRCLESIKNNYPDFLEKCGLVNQEDLTDFHNTSTASQGRRVGQFLDNACVGEYLLMFGYGAGLQSCANLYKRPTA